MKRRILVLLLTCGAVLGGMSSASADINVGAPVVNPTSTSEGFSETFTVSGTFSDTNTGALHTALIDWGDGNTDSATIDETFDTYSFSGSHTYAQSGTYSVTVTVTNDNPAMATSAGTDVTVSNVAPTVDPPNISPSTVNAGLSENFTITGTFTDPAGSLDYPFTVSFDWGDNTSETLTVSDSGNPFDYGFNASHTYTTPGTFNAFVTVIDNDGDTGTSSTTSVTVDPPTITIESAVTVSEGDGNAMFIVTQSAMTGSTTNFDYYTTPGTALDGDDYTGADGVQVSIPAGDTSTTISIPITSDNLHELAEEFTVTIANPDNATIAPGGQTGTVTINDDDPAPSFTIDDVTQLEGDSGTTAYEFTVTKSNQETALVATVDYLTVDGSAVAPGDYTSVPQTTLTFQPTDTTMTVTVDVNGDTAVEADKAFTVQLVNENNGTIADAEGIGTIQDDDVPPASLVVTKTADTDDGSCSPTDCSLREAIDAANLNADTNTITFNLSGGGPHLISLTLGELAITQNVTITGLGANVLTVQRDSGAADFRIFSIDTGNIVTITGLTIANGRATGSYPGGSGAGIFNRGALTLTSVTVSGNTSDLHGAGLYIEAGPVNVTDSTFDNNQVLPGSTQVGGGLMMSVTSSVTVTNCTFSNNSAPSGGGLMNNAGTLTITNSTIVYNAATNSSANGGGGIRTDGGTTTNLRNTIVANNTSAASGPDLLFTFSSQGYNLIENTSGATITGTTSTNITGVDPNLGPLAFNGGPTRTHALLAGSAAIDKGHSSGSSTDQRGLARPVEDTTVANASGGDGSDIGAFEVQDTASSFVVTKTADTNDGLCDADCSLREAVTAANNDAGAETITFNIPGGGPHTITLTSGELTISNVTITGPGASVVTVSGNNASRIFNIPTGAFTTNVSDLTLTAGRVTGGTGGAIAVNAGGTVTLAGLSITNCNAANGAAISNGVGTEGSGSALNINSCSIKGNIASSVGGALYLGGGTMMITGTTIGGTAVGEPNKAIVGGAMYIGTALSSLTMTGGSITGNQANGIVGNPNGVGGAIYAPTGTVTFTGVNITFNSVTKQSGGQALGGGIYRNGASVITVNLCRFFGNTADTGQAINNSVAGNIDATNNWWGCDGLPNTGSCQTATGTITTSPRIDLVLTASPSTVALGGTSTLTADFSKNSSGTTINPTVMNGLPITFTGGSFGSVSPTGSTITSLQATTTFTAGSTGGITTTTAQVDNAPAATAPVTITPTVTSSTAALAANASSMTISGTGFSTTPGNNVVAFNNGATGVVTAATSTQLTVTSLTGLLSGPLNASVTVNGASSGAPVQVATVFPAVTLNTGRISPNPTTVTINGFGFSSTPGNNTVALSSGTGNVTAASLNSLTLTFTSQPAGGPLTAVVTSNSQSSDAPVQIATVDQQPVITNGPPPSSAMVGTAYNFTYSATGYPAPTFSVTSGALPAGLSLSSAGAITGTPTARGIFMGTVTASNGVGTAATQDFTITVTGYASQTVVVSSDPSSSAGQSVTLTATVTPNQMGAPSTVTGTVEFFDGATPILCDEGGSSTQTLNGSGVATCTTSGISVTVAPHIIKAQYSGDPNFEPSMGTTSQSVCSPSPVVTSAADSGAGSLREAIATACPDGTITFNIAGAGPHIINLTSGELVIDKNLTITGLGAKVLTVRRDSAAAQSRVFYVATSTTAEISGMTISGGDINVSDRGGLGGGIYNDGTLTLTGGAISGNKADNANGGGGGIYNSTALNMSNCTISGNMARFEGGAMRTGGTLTMTNCTVSGNTTGTNGAIFAGGTATLRNCTVSSNTTNTSGGGIYENGGTINLGNTIVANNTAPTNPDLEGTFNSQGYNLIENTSGATINETANPGTNITGQDPQLGSLQDNGGPTFTHAPDPGSPAIDKGKDLSATGEDQRGSMRPVRYSNTIAPAAGGDFSDIGAVELAAPGPCTPPPSDMIAWWTADGNTTDIKGGHNGTLQNGASYGPGEVAQAFTFDGVNDRVTVASTTALESTAITLDAWIFVDPTANPTPTLGIISKYFSVTGERGYELFINENQKLVLRANSINQVNLITASNVAFGQWVHVAATIDSSASRIYINGNLEASGTGAPAIEASSSSVMIGAREGLNPAGHFKGRIDEVEVFSRALAQSEVQAIYNAGAAGKCKPCTPPPNNMVSWWSGDGHPNDIQDGNQGTLAGGATYANAMVGPGFALNGTTARVEVPDSASLSMTGAISVDAWINPDTVSGTRGVITKYDSSLSVTAPYVMWLENGILNFQVSDGSLGNYRYAIGTTTIPAGAFTHVAGTFDPATQEIKLYVNGVDELAPIGGGSSTVNSLVDNASPVRIGVYDTGQSSGFFDGTIDEVEIFNRALSAAEIQALYAANSSGKCKPPPVVQFSAATYTFNEGVGNATLTVTRTGDSSGTSTVQYATAPGTAGAGDDYTTTTGTLTFGPGVITQEIPVPINNDALDETNEDFTVSLSSPSSGTTIGMPGTATVTINDNDDPPTLSINDASAVTEGGNATFTVTQSAPSGLETSFKYSTSDGTAVAPDDYTSATDELVTIPAGETTAMFSITTINDTLYEGGNETFTVTLSDPTNATIADGSGTGTIQDNDAAPVFSISDVTQTETDAGTTEFKFIVTKSGATQLSSSVKYQTADDTAVAPGDYTAVALTTLTFAPGDTSMEVSVFVNGDTTLEPDETFKVLLSVPVNATVGDNEGVGTIRNDDTDVSVTVSPDSVTEDGGTNLVYTFTRNPLTSGPITVNFSVSGTADPATDFAGTSGAATGTVEIPAGQTSATVTIDPSTDTAVEPNETVTLTVTSGTGYNIGGASSAEGMIINDDTAVSVAVSPPSVPEDGSDLVYTFTRTGVTTGEITVNFGVSGSATRNVDYTSADFSSSTGSVVFGDGVTTKTVTVHPLSDTIYETDETVVLTVTSGSGYNPGSPGAAPGTITNDAVTGPKPSLTIGDKIAFEGDTGGATPFVFTVTKSGSTEVTTTVTFTTSDGATNPATGAVACGAGVDYESKTGSVTFLPNETSKTITISVCRDLTVESNETFLVQLSNVSESEPGEPDATLADSEGRGTIQNDDSPGTALIVNTTSDHAVGPCEALPGGDCTLREAITAAGGSPGADLIAINFAIPANDARHFYYKDDGVLDQVTLAQITITDETEDSGIGNIDPDWPYSWWSIELTSALPATTHPVVINGYSQTAASVNTITTGTNARLRIELSGENAGGTAVGLTVSSGTTTVRGLVINRFGSHGVALPSGNSSVAGNFIGTDVSGTLDLGNGGHGINATGFSESIGGSIPGEINLISGNAGDGILFSNSNSNLLLGNLIGTTAAGSTPLGNSGNGIRFSGVGAGFNTIGGSQAGDSNTIAFNGGDGVQADNTAGNGNAIRGNSIYSNGTTSSHLGIDLGDALADGVTPNDAAVANEDADADLGPNGLQNFPIITVARVTGSTKTITGTLNSTPNETFTIDFYANTTCDNSGNGEGQTYLGSMTTGETDSNGDVSFTFHPDVAHAAGMTVDKFITATATATGAAFNTSEFSACVAVIDGSSGKGTIEFTSMTYSVAEDGMNAAITVRRDSATTNGSVTATLSTSDGTAHEPGDYAPTSVSITYIEGESGTKTVNVPIVNDLVHESSETVILNLSDTQITSPDLISSGSPRLPNAPRAMAQLTITDNDPVPSFAVDDVILDEGNSSTTAFTFTVAKTGSTAVDASVNYATVNGSATAPDFTAASGTLIFLPGETTKQVTVLVSGDTVVESDEDFTVHLSNPVEATISDADGTGSIRNDDSPVPTPTPTPSPTPTPTPTPIATPPPSPTPAPSPTAAQSLNISTRMRVETGDRAMIAGFIIQGNGAKPVLLRGMGPSLAAFGISDVLLDPVLELRGPSTSIMTNDNWVDSPQRSQFEGTPFQPSDNREAVVLGTLSAGNYTALLTGQNNTAGVGLVEVYDRDVSVNAVLANISTRGFVQADENVMIGGFILGSRPNNARIAVRGIGPSLAQFGLNPVLQDPALELRDANGALLISNEDWTDDPVAAAQLTANGLGLSESKESGIFTSLPPGQFTAILAGQDGGIGIGLIEIYNLE